MNPPFDPARLRVLIVDDDPPVCDSLERFLADRDFGTATATTAAQALALAASRAFDFAIVDIRLPDLSGDVLITQLRALQPRLRFLIHTGSASFQLSTSLAPLGVTLTSLFHKPVADMGVFVTAMRQLWEADQQ